MKRSLALGLFQLVVLILWSLAYANEFMTDRCSGPVAFPHQYADNAHPAKTLPPTLPAPETAVLLNRNATWTAPFTVVLNNDGFIRWWCLTTDDGQWHDERSRCADHSHRIRACLGSDRLLLTECLTQPDATTPPCATSAPTTNVCTEVGPCGALDQACCQCTDPCILGGICNGGVCEASDGAQMYAGIWQIGSGQPQAARHGMSPEQYQQEFDRLGKEGFWLVQVDGYSVGGQDRYAAIWEKASGPPQVARHGMSSEQYQQEFDKLGKEGFRLVLVDGYSIGGQDRYAAIWEKASGPPQVVRHGMSSEQYQQEFDKLGQEGFRLVHVSGYSVYPSVGGQDRYAAIWEKASGPPQVARHGMSPEQYQQEFDRLGKEGYRLVQVDGYNVGGRARYAAIWEKASGPPQVARHGMSSEQYQQEYDKLSKEGYRLVQVSGYGVAK